jgi:CheY-like chemotaxis protein
MHENQCKEQDMVQSVAQEHPMLTTEPLLVLIVEDEEPIATALSFIVEDAGYVPLIAMHGRQALDLLRDRHPALIITDLMMRARYPDLPIVLMTAAGVQHSVATDADEIVPKPFNIADIEELLDRYLLRLETDTPRFYAH